MVFSSRWRGNYSPPTQLHNESFIEEDSGCRYRGLDLHYQCAIELFFLKALFTTIPDDEVMFPMPGLVKGTRVRTLSTPVYPYYCAPEDLVETSPHLENDTPLPAVFACKMSMLGLQLSYEAMSFEPYPWAALTLCYKCQSCFHDGSHDATTALTTRTDSCPPSLFSPNPHSHIHCQHVSIPSNSAILPHHRTA